jgi:hypothetical protein
MPELIALPDTYASFQPLKAVLAEQGYELTKHEKVLGFSVQEVRLMDVFIVAPFLLYAGTLPSIPKSVRYGLIGLGVATLLYNGYHYLKNKPE